MTYPRYVAQAVAEHFSLPVDLIWDYDRRPVVARARMLAMKLCREQLLMSTVDIGKAFGRDHSTVISACNRITPSVERDAEIMRRADRLADWERYAVDIVDNAAA